MAVVDKVTETTLRTLIHIGLEEEASSYEEMLNDIRTELFREGTSDKLIGKLFGLFANATRELC